MNLSYSTIEVFTTSHLVIGRSAAVVGSARLVDVLNQQPSLVLTECKIYPLRRRTDPLVFGVTSTLSRDRIVWARPIESGGWYDGNRRTTLHDRIEKLSHPAVVLAPPFQMFGSLHIPDAVDPALAVGSMARGFLPLTDATITIDDEDEAQWESDVIAINGRRCDVIASEKPDVYQRPVTLHTYLEAS